MTTTGEKAMTTIAEGNRRLLVLADFLEKLPPERFYYCHWAGPNAPKQMSLEGCGTTACALGWATAIPEFQALGLHLAEDGRGAMCVALEGEKLPMWEAPMAAGREVFQLTSGEFNRLFVPNEPDPADPDGRVDESDATPAYVASKIRRLVAERCGEQPFEDFCAELGYDNDSRAAEKIWKACTSTGPRVRRLLGEDFDLFAGAEH